MAILDDALDALNDQGITDAEIARKAQARVTDAPKQHFLQYLLDPELSPTDYVVQMQVTNWPAFLAFFLAPPTEEYNLQRAYQSILADIQDAIAAQDAQKLLISLLLGAKAVKP